MQAVRAHLKTLLVFLGFGLLATGGAAATTDASQGVHGNASDGIVFVRGDEKSIDVWRARISDGATRRLIHTPERDERWPYWSPVASLLVFEGVAAGERAGVRLLLWDPETGRESPLPVPVARRQDWAAWEPAGPRLIFAFRSRRGQGPAFGIGVIDPRTRERVLLARSVPPKKPFFRPELAPGGNRAVAQRRISQDRQSALWLLESGAEPRRLVGGNGSHVSKGRFTRDGEWIVFTRQESLDGLADVMLIRPDGSELHPLASAPESDDHTPRASPTRDEIVFISNRDGKEDLFLTDLTGAEVRNITREIDSAMRVPRWSPDGERIALLARPVGTQPTDASETSRTASDVIVIDRKGKLLLRTPGFSADFMPPWK
jgi:Tol biopolymer transport system component